MVNFRFARAGSSADRSSSASTAEESRAAGSNQNQRGALLRGGGEGAARGHGRGGGGVAAAGSNSSRGNSSISVARAASSSSSDPPNEEDEGQEDIQNSRQRRLGPGSARTAKRKVLRLLDSPRRVIMSARRQQQGGGGSGIGGGNASDIGHSNAAMAPSNLEEATAASPAPSIMVPALGGGNGRQVSPHYSHFRLDGVSTRAMLKAARARSQEQQQQLQLRGNDVDLPAGSGPSAFGGGGRAGATFPSQETAATASSSLGAVPSSSTRTKSDIAFIERGSQHDVLSWLHDEAPQDILPRVLSFAGSRRIDALSRTCKSWRTLTLSEPVWRTACEDTGKWRPGVDGPVSGSWLQHYVDNPIVPTDYGTIEAAFHANNDDGGDRESRNPFPARDGGRHASSAVREHRRSIRVLLRPDRYVIRDALVVHAVADAEVTIETVEPPVRPSFRGANEDEKEAGGTALLASSSGSRRGVLSTARDMLTCRSSSAAANDGRAGDNDNDNNVGHEDEDDPMDDYSDSLSPSRPSSERANSQPSQSSRGGSGGGASSSRPSPPRRAVLVLKTRRPNEPIVRVRQGTVRLSKLDLVHNAAGTDIWNGNAAVQVQPPFDENDHPVRAVPPSRPPTAVLDSVDVTSVSGRGVVTIDGGYATVRNCHIHDCAATGIYIGGPGSVATIENTDVLENGNGNLRSRRGIARGHSGVYLEQGVATLRDCNVSRNSLTGISAISADNATLEIEDSDLVSNGSIQLEMPPAGSASRRRSVSRNNRMAAMGMGRSRSGLVPEEEEGRRGDGNSSSAESSPARDDRPQSPLADASPPPLPHARHGGLPVRGLPAAANFFY